MLGISTTNIKLSKVKYCCCFAITVFLSFADREQISKLPICSEIEKDAEARNWSIKHWLIHKGM